MHINYHCDLGLRASMKGLDMGLKRRGSQTVGLVLLTLALASCGGGGGASKSPSPTPAPPVTPPVTPPPPVPAAFTFDVRLYSQGIRPVGSAYGYQRIAAGDFNGDGRDDLVSALDQSDVYLYLQRGDGTFSQPIAYDEPPTYIGTSLLVVADFNNDGADDVVLSKANGPGNLAMFLSTGTSGAPPVLRDVIAATRGESGAATNHWVAMDVDRDENMDLVALHTWKIDDTEFGCVNDEVCLHLAIYPGDGHGNFGTPRLMKLNGLPEMQLRDPFVEDADLDGVGDLVFESLGGNQARQIFYAKRRPNGGLDQPRLFLDMETESSPIFFGDLNSDGLRDAIHGAVVHFRKPDGGFQSPVLMAIRNFLQAYWNVLGDFDGNGQTDIVNHQFEMAFALPYFATYLQENGMVQPPFFLYDPQTAHSTVNPDVWSRQAAAVGDFNSDGCRDIAVAAGYAGIVFLEGRNCIK